MICSYPGISRVQCVTVVHLVFFLWDFMFGKLGANTVDKVHLKQDFSFEMPDFCIRPYDFGGFIVVEKLANINVCGALEKRCV